MEYICTYFNTKIAAIGYSFGLVKNAWDEQIWLAVILMVLWTMFCIIGGMLLFPIDFIWGAILWHRKPVFREAVKDMADEFTPD